MRLENIAENISSQLSNKNKHVKWFSLALDEYEVHKELVDMYSFHGTTTSTDVFEEIENGLITRTFGRKAFNVISLLEAKT